MDIYAIGEMLIDFTPTDQYLCFQQNAGGAPANVAIAATKFGAKASLCCSVGDDNFGHFLYKILELENVFIINPDFCQNAITTLAFVTLDAGERSFVFVRKPGADSYLDAAKVRCEDIASTKIVHAGSCSLSQAPASLATVKALKLGHEMGKLVSFDVNYRDLMWDNNQQACLEAVIKILPYVDILKVSEEESSLFNSYSDWFRLMQQFDIKLVIETLGAAGVRFYFENEVYLLSNQMDFPCIDATGAGDAFLGTFLAHLLELQTVKIGDIGLEQIITALKSGCVAGGLCVTRKGAIQALPTRDAIFKLGFDHLQLSKQSSRTEA